MSDYETPVAGEAKGAEVAVIESLSQMNERHHAEFGDRLCDEMNDCAVDHDVLQSAADAIEGAEDGLSVAEGTAVVVSLERLLAKYGQTAPAFEQYGTKRQKHRQTQYAIETIKEAIVAAYRKLIELLKRAGEWIKSFFTRNRAQEAIIAAKSAKYQAASKKADEDRGTGKRVEPSEPIRSESLAAVLNVDGTPVSGDDLISTYRHHANVVKFIYSQMLQRVEDGFTLVQEAMQAVTGDDLEKAKELVEKAKAQISAPPDRFMFTNIAKDSPVHQHGNQAWRHNLVFGQKSFYYIVEPNVGAMVAQSPKHRRIDPQTAVFEVAERHVRDRLHSAVLSHKKDLVADFHAKYSTLNRQVTRITADLSAASKKAIDSETREVIVKVSSALSGTTRILLAVNRLDAYNDTVQNAILTYCLMCVYR